MNGLGQFLFALQNLLLFRRGVNLLENAEHHSDGKVFP